RRSAPLTVLDMFEYVSLQPRIQCWPVPGTANGGTGPLHLILCGIPLARGGACPGPPAFGVTTEQPGIEGMAPFATVPIVWTSTASQRPVAVDDALDGASFAVSRKPTAWTCPAGAAVLGSLGPISLTLPGLAG